MITMASSRPTESSATNSARSKHSARIIQQTIVDAKLHADFEESGDSFDYSSSVHVSTTVIDGQQPRFDKVTTAYLHHIQKGKLIQPFGCLLALDEKTFKVIAFSENAPEMLTMVSHSVPTVGDQNPVLGIGTDVRTIFAGPSATALLKALGFGEVSLLNPILVHCKTSGKPFYAIIHRVTGSLIIDFEPVMPNEVPMTAAGALQSYKQAAKAIARLQSLPSGSIERLCDTMVQEVFELTGYDRVMAYKFHDDDHGEVVAEITKPGLDPYLGLHYPATDIPQAARFLFMKNKYYSNQKHTQLDPYTFIYTRRNFGTTDMITMASSRPTESSATNSARSKHSARIFQQTIVDAKLHADFEESGDSFDYSSSVHVSTRVIDGQQPKSDKLTTAYLHHIQKGKLIQPFGCLLALDEKTYKVIAFSENAPEMLTMVSHTVPTVGENPVLEIGTDVRTIFAGPGATALFKALGFGEVSLLNPILVHCKTSGKPFYAIIHRVTGSLIIDFEPVMPNEVPVTAAGALQSYKQAAKAIARLQSLPSGSIERLCDTMVQEVFELTGYDRVMAYKFHDDDHGEVVAEITKPGLVPYLGLHYPATDIPQAARFLFMKNKVRIICDCRANNVKVVQDKKLPFDLTLCGSNLRAPHSCHIQYMENMTSIASLVMSVVINDVDEEGQTSEPQKRKKLWGLVVCHNTAPRFVSFPLRYACEFLAQVFEIHINKELELENQILEKNILRTQTILCDLLMRDAPLGIVSQSPNIMDLVKCDGAALLYKNKVYRMGVSPTDSQVHDIVSWLCEYHMDSTGLSTDSLYDAGYPGALAIGDVVCGMASVKLTEKDILFWFRSNTASEIRWGGAKHEKGDKDDGKRMHPRSSFKAFLEVVRMRSFPWKDFEMDAIHSLQLIMRNALKDNELKTDVIQAGFNELKLNGMQELEAVTSEMVRLIETASVPILAVDADGSINGWNAKIAELTGLTVEEAIGSNLLTLVDNSSVETVQNMLNLALEGKEESGVQFEIKTYGSRRESGPITLVVNACASRDVHENVVGVCCIAQDITHQKTIMDKFTRIEGDYKALVHNPNPLIPPIFGTDEFGWCSEWNQAMTELSGLSREQVIDKMLLGELASNLQQAIHFERMSEQIAAKRLKALAYVRRQIKNPLSGIIFSRKMMEGTELGDEQKELLHTSALCQKQLNKVLDDTDLDSIIDGYLDLEMTEFTLQQILGASVSQVMTKSDIMGIQIVNNVAEDMLLEKLYGDSVRLQQVLADFLSLSVSCTPAGGVLAIAANLRKDLIAKFQLVNLELRITHTGGVVPEELLRQMFGSSMDATEEGISLVISRNLLKLMSGDVQYLRETTKSTFIITVELACAGSRTS
ncbi:phytochrome a [Artemisia annua]|uniref:Phytochrome a n=1 Tax=Artemisia annua TaxID=35608 RepID=A0A2U1LIF2_ARTAN|nr:phytochrome a [Artemisia annua]